MLIKFLRCIPSNNATKANTTTTHVRFTAFCCCSAWDMGILNISLVNMHDRSTYTFKFSKVSPLPTELSSSIPAQTYSVRLSAVTSSRRRCNIRVSGNTSAFLARPLVCSRRPTVGLAIYILVVQKLYRRDE